MGKNWKGMDAKEDRRQRMGRRLVAERNNGADKRPCDAKVRSSRPLALIVVGSCAEVKDHVPDMKQLKEISLVVFDPLTKKYEERGVRQRVTCIQVGSQPANRRTVSVDAQMPDGHTIEYTIDVLEDCAPMEVWEAFVQNPFKAVTISLLRLDPDMENVYHPTVNPRKPRTPVALERSVQFKSSPGTRLRRKLRS